MARFLVEIECVDANSMAQAIRAILESRLPKGSVVATPLEDMQLLTRNRYDELVEIEIHMSVLEARGVDNWPGYCSLPSREDYDTEAEWYAAINTASESW